MIPFRPKTYNDVLMLQRCNSFSSSFPGLSQEQQERIFHFIRANDKHNVYYSDGILSLRNADGATIDSFAVQYVGAAITYALLSSTQFHISRPYIPSSGGDSGSSGNNNNNNNNNNNG